jgi:hypothetical protein
VERYYFEHLSINGRVILKVDLVRLTEMAQDRFLGDTDTPTEYCVRDIGDTDTPTEYCVCDIGDRTSDFIDSGKFLLKERSIPC